MKTKFQRAVEQRKIAGRLRPSCTCYDCIRAAGLTPPKGELKSYPRRYPYAVPELVDMGENPPRIVLDRVRSEDKPLRTSDEAKEHLREAVRNREAI